MDEKALFLSSEKKSVGVFRSKSVAPIRFAGSQTVAEHFCHIFFGHFHAYDALTTQAVVCPILEMVAVAAFMMQPGGAVSLLSALGIVGAAITLKIPGTGKKFHRGVFG